MRKNVSNMKYPIGIQTFDKIIDGGYSYVDNSVFWFKIVDISSTKIILCERSSTLPPLICYISNSQYVR